MAAALYYLFDKVTGRWEELEQNPKAAGMTRQEICTHMSYEVRVLLSHIRISYDNAKSAKSSVAFKFSITVARTAVNPLR